MSALGQLGPHKYEGHAKQDFASRCFNIAEDIRLPKDTALDETKAKVRLLELTAINKPNGKLRQVLHKGFSKRMPWDFKTLVDKKKLKEAKIEQERESRLQSFQKDLDSIEL